MILAFSGTNEPVFGHGPLNRGQNPHKIKLYFVSGFSLSKYFIESSDSLESELELSHSPRKVVSSSHQTKPRSICRRALIYGYLITMVYDGSYCFVTRMRRRMQVCVGTKLVLMTRLLVFHISLRRWYWKFRYQKKKSMKASTNPFSMNLIHITKLSLFFVRISFLTTLTKISA